MSSKTGIALYGVGRIGQVHLKNILSNPRIDLLWIVEGNRELVQEVKKTFHVSDDVRVASIEEIPKVLADTRVKGVCICTPTDTHAKLSRQALQSGKAVMCEKPLSENLEEIIACYDDAEKYGSMLFCAFNRHFDPAIRELHTKARSGELGKVSLVRSTFRDRPLWLGAKTLSQTFLIHDIDIICWFADDLPDSVVCQASATIKEVADRDDVDTIVVTMKFPSGMIAILDHSRYSPYGYDIRLEVLGSEAMLIADAKVKSSVKTYMLEGKRDAELHTSFPDRFHDAYIAELNHFIDAIQGITEIEIKRVSSERVGLVINAIKESYRTGQVVYLKKK